ncbi:putative nepenthesin [Rosa chinensis]|uniref:Putative nepenthesin n=1 Tax=Rosa chinensis TaxID=74649 RepID=A0A2P6RLL7_ROSCH|nr:aspartyl protease family protein 1 isoform X7 [Rosa chinensis]PRQ47332.1 putative nepenthesin [Rosa chinensis]
MATWTGRASSSNSTLLPLLVIFLLGLACRSCNGFGTFGFNFHHRFSDPVTGILGYDELPQKGSPEYYAAITHRDRLIRGRHLGETKTPLTFVYGNETYRIPAFGHLHYANVSVGTPRTSYLVALDTGSDLLWLPCDCISCVKGVDTSHGELDFDIYSPNKSTTSKRVPCNSTYCEKQQQCSSPSSDCRYNITYLSANTSSSGIVVEDVLHLITDDAKLKGVEAPIAFGCGKIQTGIFLSGAAPNGLLGLGMDDVSIPSMLAKQGLASNSFSMCFGINGTGRIRFGDNGSVDQPETPFYVRDKYPTYNITVTQIAIGKSVADLDFYAIWDSGTSFTYLNDPAYTQISKSFNSAIKDKRATDNSDLPFEYCYTVRPNQTLNLTMKGGKQYNVIHPHVVLSDGEGNILFYCLGVVKSEDVNIIGQNFMTGYRIIFDREKMVMGWTESDCYHDEETSTLPISPSKSPAASPTVYPEATVNTTSKIPSASSPSDSPKLNSFTCALLMVLSAIFATV